MAVLRGVLLIWACMTACLLGCSEPARQENYPRELQYIDEITQAMQQLSLHMQQLEDLTRPDKPSPQARLEILAALNGMDQSAAHLEASGWPKNHPPFNVNLDSFRRDIKSAREAAEREPPDYSSARSMERACVTCHKGQ
jgi:hypothetical protein